MKVLVLCPMHSEKVKFQNALKGYKKPLVNEYSVRECGIGETAAAITAAAELQRALDKNKMYDCVAVVGFAAGSRHYTQGEFVSASYVRSYLYSKELRDICSDDEFPFSIELSGLDSATIFSGDTFATKELVKETKRKFGIEECLFDMETLGVAQAAKEYNIPCYALRIVSDIPENLGTAQEEATKSFSEFVGNYGDFYIPLSYLENSNALLDV